MNVPFGFGVKAFRVESPIIGILVHKGAEGTIHVVEWQGSGRVVCQKRLPFLFQFQHHGESFSRLQNQRIGIQRHVEFVAKLGSGGPRPTGIVAGTDRGGGHPQSRRQRLIPQDLSLGRSVVAVGSRGNGAGQSRGQIVCYW